MIVIITELSLILTISFRCCFSLILAVIDTSQLHMAIDIAFIDYDSCFHKAGYAKIGHWLPILYY